MNHELSRVLAVVLVLISCAEPEPPRVPEAAVDRECPASMDAVKQAYPGAAYVHSEALSRGRLVVAFKERRQLALYVDGVLGAGPTCWPMALAAPYPSGPKQREGDRRTPEGVYGLSDKPWSSFYAAIAVHYPNDADADAGVASGRIDEPTASAIRSATARGEKPVQNSPLGGEILIHGGGSQADWTLGCLALNDADIDALRAQLADGMTGRIVILP